MAKRGSRVKQTAPVKGRIGNTTPNQRAVITTGTGSRRVRVLRALDPMSYRTLQRQAPGRTTLALNNFAVTKNQVIQRGKQLLGGRRQNVRRLYRKDPYNIFSATAPPPFGTNATVAMFSPEAERVDILNTNPSFHPEAAGPSPGSVSIVRQPQAAAGTRNRGKVMRPNLQTVAGGKTLRRV